MSPGIPTRLLATQSDERLVSLAGQGHERAFEALVRRYRRPLLNYCRRLGLPEAGAEDVLQQAMLKAWIALHRGSEVRAPRAWLYRVVHNTALNAIRDAAHDSDRQLDPSLPDASGELDLDRGLRVREALTEVAALRPLQREVIVRTAIAGHSHERVASDLGLSDGAVRGLLYRARASLRTAVSALTPPPLLGLLLRGAATQSGGAPERLGELASGAGTASLGGLLAKGGVAMIAAGTILTGAVVVHTQTPAPHHRSQPASVAGPHGASAASAASGPGSASSSSEDVALELRSGDHRSVATSGSQHARTVASLHAHGPSGSAVSPPLKHSSSVTSVGAPGSSSGPATTQPSTSAQGVASPPTAQVEGSGHAEAPTDPTGSAAGAGSGSSTGSTTGSSTAPSGGGSGTTSPGASESPASSEAGTGSGSEPSSGETGALGSAVGATETLVETVVHGVGGLVEGVTHGLLH
jgi:RNA polymerase sigma factor (sigma-70 family)